jgi:hypothetical protein
MEQERILVSGRMGFFLFDANNNFSTRSPGCQASSLTKFQKSHTKPFPSPYWRGTLIKFSRCRPSNDRTVGAIIHKPGQIGKSVWWRWVRFSLGTICLMVHWPSELGLCRRFAPVDGLRRPGRRTATTGRRPEAPDLSRPGTRKSAPILKRTRRRLMVSSIRADAGGWGSKMSLSTRHHQI